MNQRQTGPIFVIGRQHSGNTLLVILFQQHPTVLGLRGEGTFFEYWPRIERMNMESKMQRVVHLVNQGADGLPSDVQAELAATLRDFTRRAGPEEQSAVILYSHAMEFLTARQGKTRWVQKATSYVFQVERIWRALPASQFVYLARNPLDLASSLKRRGQPHAIVRMAYAWNKGIRRAETFARQFPRQFLLARYEDLMRSPQETASRIFDFCGLEWRSEYAQVPHVNPAEAPYKILSETLGLDSSRALNYPAVLTDSEQAVVYATIDRSLLARHYPELPSRGPRWATHLPSVAKLALQGIASLLWDQGGQFLSRPGQTAARIWRRLA